MSIKEYIVRLLDSFKHKPPHDDNGHLNSLYKIYEDKLTVTVDKFNNVIKEQHLSYNDHPQELISQTQKSEIAMNHLNKEFKTPYQAANSFRTLLEKQAFGPLNPMYLEYFNDLYIADIEFYCMVNKVLELQKLQSNLNNSEIFSYSAEEIIQKINDKYFSSKNTANVELSYNINCITDKAKMKSFIEQIIDNIISIFFTNICSQTKYNVNITLDKTNCNNSDILQVSVEFNRSNIAEAYVNDNFNNLPLNQLINHIKNFEDTLSSGEDLIIDFNNLIIREKINILNFLTIINRASIVASVSSNAIIFKLEMLCSEVICKQDQATETA